MQYSSNKLSKYFIGKNMQRKIHLGVCLASLRRPLRSSSQFASCVTCNYSKMRFRYSFICHGTPTRGQLSDLFGLRVKLPPVTTYLSTLKGRGNFVKCLAQGHKRTCRPYLHTNPFLRWKQESCEFKTF